MADVGRHPCCGLFPLALLTLAALLPGGLHAAGSSAAPPAASNEVAAKFAQQRVRQIVADRLPGLSPEAVERTAQGFEQHLRLSSRLFSENYYAGRLEDEELLSRVSVYLHDNPALLGRPTPAADDVSTRVGRALALRETAPRPPIERTALTERFLASLAAHSRLAHQNLVSGRMSDEELASRLSVFLEDMRVNTAATAGPDAAQTAAAELVADQFVRKNFGSPNERATSLVYDCAVTSTDTGRSETLRFIRKAPDKIRIHFLQDSVVTLAMGHDGTNSWIQRPAKPVEQLSAKQAAVLVESAAFDHPLVGYRERGTRLTLSGGGTQPYELTLSETDGRSVTSIIDPLTLEESRQLTRTATGVESELRLRDYRRIESTNIPLTQELWRGGALLVTMKLDRIRTDATLLNALFTTPQRAEVSYMDYMGGLALLQARAAAATAAAPTKQP